MEKITIVKVGGAIVEDEKRLPQALKAFAAIDGPKILVHGGGRSATKVAADLGIESHMVDGRRITDADMLRVVTMVYGGLVNKQLVARLQALGVNAIGLTGADMNVIRSHKRPLKNGIDYGFVGDVDHVDATAIHHLLLAGLTPVIAPLTHDGQGHMLNTNADTMASETAKAMANMKTANGEPCLRRDTGILFRKARCARQSRRRQQRHPEHRSRGLPTARRQRYYLRRHEAKDRKRTRSRGQRCRTGHHHATDSIGWEDGNGGWSMKQVMRQAMTKNKVD